MKAHPFGKSLFPYLSCPRSHLARAMPIPVQYLRNALGITIRDPDRKFVPRNVIIRLPYIGEGHACAAHLHRLEEPDTTHSAPRGHRLNFAFAIIGRILSSLSSGLS